jgi:3'-phosphoadenosine 5'-phosphosulfate sulfotransferase (PAPS reductase)/FAD synthetase
MQLIASTRLQDAMPAAYVAPVLRLSFAEKVAGAVEVVKHQLRSGKRLLLAISMGKDSSVMLSITLTAMEQLKADGFVLPELYVLNVDTLMENPRMSEYTKGEFQSLREYAQAKDLPVRIWICSPNLSENWLVSIIGGRTVHTLPGNSRKCQQAVKAGPLDRAKRQIRAIIKAEQGASFKEENIVTMIGTRRDESAVRERKMAERRESAFEPTNMAGEGERPSWVLSPIADLDTMDIFTYLAEVTNGRIKTYSNFEELTQVYRDAAGECMVNIFMRDGTAERKTGCGARTGCWTCGAVGNDASMENMLTEESGKYVWMKPLNDFRNYLIARHFDPKGRNWLARSIDPVSGNIKIAANSYSPELCLELLRFALTIDADEAHWARRNNKAPRFQLLGMKEILTIDLYWGRYGYQPSFTALNEYKEIFENDQRYYIPDQYQKFARADLDVTKSVSVPFADEHFNGMHEGLRSVVEATAGAEAIIKKGGIYYTSVNESNEFDIDAESVEMFFEFELERTLKKYGPNADVPPSEVVHYLARLGVVSLKKGGHSAWDKMLRIGNQLHRHGIRHLLSNPAALIAKLTGHQQAPAPAGAEDTRPYPIAQPSVVVMAPARLIAPSIAANTQFQFSF